MPLRLPSWVLLRGEVRMIVAGPTHINVRIALCPVCFVGASFDDVVWAIVLVVV